MIEPVTVSVPLDELRDLIRLAHEAGEDLEANASAEHTGDHPATVRRRDRDIAAARSVIRAAERIDQHLPAIF